ncbi:MAG: serpin family protein [Gemmataceae bacterium]|nr:serpin family protein [Gemmataceae bacterium]
MLSPVISRRKFFTLSGAAALAGLAPRFGRADGLLPNPLTRLNAATAAVNAFATDLFRHYAGEKGEQKGNLFFSPFSIETALAMTAAGARGDTLGEMQKTLHLPEDPHAAFGDLITRLSPPAGDKKDRPYELSVANAIWAQKDFPWEKDFAALTRKNYGAGMVPVNFAASEAARKEINAWVEKETKEKIKDLIPPGVIDNLTRMVLANAIYFKSNWAVQFDKKLTKDAPFTRDDGSKTDVPLMSLKARFNYGRVLFGGRAGVLADVLEMPYAGKDLSMLVYLPEKPGETAKLIDRFATGTAELRDTEVEVLLPRFKAESALSLKPALTELGMKKAFVSGQADFTGMSPQGKELFIAAVLHKAFVEVNEEGTEAAAATAVVVKGKGLPPKPAVFRADRPFVFAIRDNATGAVLFLGRYAGPN